ncbi:MAG: hypothetical protein H7145_12490 [Akkermansiaceae bacterium]|nr:hypothetical protein [Armatimonadota bacterium]
MTNNDVKPRRARRPRTVHEALQRSLEELKKLSKEELAERMTTYVPGVEHRWFGRPVEPITKEELLAHWNGGPEPEIRYKDVPGASQAPTAAAK